MPQTTQFLYTSNSSKSTLKTTIFGDVMNRLADGPTLEYSDDARYASQVLLNAADNPVPVLRNGEIVGLLRGSDILQWMLLHQAGGRRNMLIGSFTGVGSSDD